MAIGEATATRSSGGDVGWPLQRAVRLYGSSEAIVDGQRTVSYADLGRRVGGLCAGLEALGVPAGGRVGFLGVNSLAHVECAIGVPAAGRALVDLNFRLAEAELAFVAADCDLELLVVDRAQLDVGRSLRASCPSLTQLVLDDAGSCPADCLPYEQLIERDPIEPPSIDGEALPRSPTPEGRRERQRG